jgi:hypothetical protein
MSPSDCSTPPVITSAVAAGGGVASFAERLARNAPAAPIVMHDAATTATVDVLISIAEL